MDNVPVRTHGPAAVGQTPEAPHHEGRRKKNKKKPVAIAAAIVVLVVLVSLAGWFMYRSSASAYINNGEYQAVFFTNGQVYFGKLQKLGGSYFKLTDVFYLQAKDSNSKNPQQTADQQTADMQLIKLGSEIHGPEDQMIMSKDQVLFFENLKKDGKVSQSIDQYNKDQKK